MLRKIIYIIITGIILSACTLIPGSDAASNAGGYGMITVEDLQNLIESEDITLVNVHIPLEGNIPETDAEIPFDDVENYLNLLPENKNEKIIIYCRSGGMGIVASETLVNLGYTDVSNLTGGYVAWKATGLPFGEY